MYFIALLFHILHESRVNHNMCSKPQHQFLGLHWKNTSNSVSVFVLLLYKPYLPFLLCLVGSCNAFALKTFNCKCIPQVHVQNFTGACIEQGDKECARLLLAASLVHLTLLFHPDLHFPSFSHLFPFPPPLPPPPQPLTTSDHLLPLLCVVCSALTASLIVHSHTYQYCVGGKKTYTVSVNGL